MKKGLYFILNAHAYTLQLKLCLKRPIWEKLFVQIKLDGPKNSN